MSAKKTEKRDKGFWHNTWRNRAHVVLSLPVFIVLFFIMYVPMSGLIMAFKKFDYQLGIYKSPWMNADGTSSIFQNFLNIAASKDIFVRMTSNTLIYYVIFTILGTLLSVVLAIAIDQCVFKKASKAMQTIMIIPVFVSYAAVTFIVQAYLSADTGIINHAIINALAKADAIKAAGDPNFWQTIFLNITANWHTIKFSSTPEYWRVILTIVKMWNSVGYGSVLYMSVLAGIDQEMYEAADIDGANRMQKIWHITVPALIPMITVMLLLSVGNIMKSDTGLFYQITQNNGALYQTTQVIDSYILNAINKNSNYGFISATSFFQSVIGLLMMLLSNGIVRKIAPENALF